MKKISKAHLILTAGVSALLFFSCNKESSLDCFKRTGKNSTQERTLPPFTMIKVYDNVDVYIQQGNTQEVKIEAGDNLISLIKTKVDSGTLHINNENRCNWARSYKRGTISVYITLPTLRYIWHYGSGLVQAKDTIHCDVFDIWAHQTGDADLMINANLIFVNMHTTSDLTLRGKTGLLGIWHRGEGYLHSKELIADYAWAQTKTSGNEYLNVQYELNVTINWEGDIYYSGNPATTVSGEGKGKLIKQD